MHSVVTSLTHFAGQHEHNYHVVYDKKCHHLERNKMAYTMHEILYHSKAFFLKSLDLCSEILSFLQSLIKSCLKFMISKAYSFN